MKIRGLNLPDLHGPVQACGGTALLYYAWVFQVVSFSQVSPPERCMLPCPALLILFDLIIRMISGE